MKTLGTILLFALFAAASLFAQDTIPRFKKIPVQKSGCFMYAPDTLQFDLSYSDDSSAVYTGEWIIGDHRFAAIIVDLNNVTFESKEEKEDLLMSYMDFLQSSFEITDAVGYGKGHTLENDPTAIGVIDYWMDASADEWAVKGWINDDYIAVLMIYGAGQYPHHSIQEMYLNGIRFK